MIKAIDEVMQTLKDEGQSDIEKRDTCKEEYQSYASKSSDLKWKIKNNEAKIDKLEKKIALTKEEKAATIEQIEAVAKEIAEMEDQRIAENEEFLNAKAEDEAAIELLGKTIDVLEKFYKKNKAAVLMQGPDFEVSEDQAPDASFSDKGSRKNESKGIVSLIKMIQEDLVSEVANGKKAEAEMQMDFEKALKAAKTLKSELIDKKDELSDIIAKTNNEKIDEEDDKSKNTGDLKDEDDYKADLPPFVHPFFLVFS